MLSTNEGIVNPSAPYERIANPLEQGNNYNNVPTPTPSPSRGGERKLRSLLVECFLCFPCFPCEIDPTPNPSTASPKSSPKGKDFTTSSHPHQKGGTIFLCFLCFPCEIDPTPNPSPWRGGEGRRWGNVKSFRSEARSGGVFSLLWHLGPERAGNGLKSNGR